MRRLFFSLLAGALLLGCPEEPFVPGNPVPVLPLSPPFAPASSSSALCVLFALEPVWADGQAMGTHVFFAAFIMPAIDKARAKQIFDRALEEICRIEALMMTWSPEVELSWFNLAVGKSAVKLSSETFSLVEESIRTSVMSEGTFDIIFETLHGLWKFDQDLDPHLLVREAVLVQLKGVSYKHLELDRVASTVMIKRVETKVSLGGIAKGYAVDRATKILDDGGFTVFFVQVGGDLFARGSKFDGSAWQVGVRDPRGPEGSFFVVLLLTDRVFSIVGDYVRSYIVGGVRYYHIIDPRTGFSATVSRSVTIWSRTAFQADGIDDAVFILGPKKGLELVESLDGVGAVIVDKDNKVWVSKRFELVLKVVRQLTDGV